MLLTRIWGVILACLATFFLAGMFLVAAGSGEDFTDADRAAIEAVTEAGLAAFEAEVATNAVGESSTVLVDPRVQEVLSNEDDAVDAGQNSLGELVELLVDQLYRESSDRSITVAIIDQDRQVKASNGAAVANLPELLSGEFLKEVAPDTEAKFSVTLGGKLHVAKISRADERGNRAVGLAELDISAGSMFRRVLGTTAPAGLIRKGKLVGEVIGAFTVQADLEALAKAHRGDTPNEGASPAFVVGEGSSARIGALGRVPGPAGRGPDGALLVVLSSKTAAAGQRDLATALRRAREEGGLPTDSMILLIGLLIVTAGLSVYLPGLEGLAPVLRLTREFQAMAQGTQHALFHDRYGGPSGTLARSANAAHDALRQAYLAELEIDEEEFEANPTAPRSGPKTGGVRRPTRSHRKAPTGKRTPGRAQKRLRSSKSREVIADDREPDSIDPAADSPFDVPSDSTERAAPLLSAPPPSLPQATEPAHFAPVPPTPQPRTTAPSLPSVAPAAPPVSPQTPQVATAAARPAAESDDPADAYYQEVYEEFLQVKHACGESTTNFTYDKFAKKLAKQTSEIKKKREGVADVKFTVYVKDGKAALRAKVIKA